MELRKICLIAILTTLTVSCGNSGFFGEVNSASKANGIQKNLNSESAETTEIDSDPAIPAESLESGDPEEIDEEITAIRPVVISGSYLACTIPADREGSIVCSFKKEQELIDLSEYNVKFILKNQQENQNLNYVLREDKVSYEIENYPKDIEPTLVAATVEIDGETYSINELQILETSSAPVKNTDSGDVETVEVTEEESVVQPPSTPAIQFEELPEYSKCSDIKPNEDFQILSEDIIEIKEQSDLDSLALTARSMLLVEMSGGELIEMSLDGVDQIRALCIESSGDSVLNLNSSIHINKILLRQSSGSSMTSMMFSTGKVFNNMAVDIDGGGTLSVAGDSLDCQKVSLTRVKGGSSVVCSDNP